MVEYTGVVCVILAIGKKQVREWEVLLPYRDQGIRNIKSVSSVDLKHNKYLS